MASQTQTSQRNVGLLTLCGLALVVGTVTGIGAVALRALIGLIHNVFFLGRFSFLYDANEHTAASPWGALIILAPVIGGLVVVYLVRRFAPEARGHGVPEVMDAIFYKQGMIRPVVVVIKSLASALSIGSGASVGREGPIIQIGSGIGSSLGQVFHLRPWQTITMVAAGAGAGIAATFNTPLGGVMFAIELMLPELSARTFLPVVLATGTATYVGRIFFGVEPAFLVPMHGIPDVLFPLPLSFLPVYLFFGILCGAASALFVHVLHAMEDAFDAMPGNAYTRNIVGMLGLGILFYVLLLTVGNYHVEGVGYATIQAILTGQLTAAWLLALLFVAKLLATTVSLGSGASGGIFSPSLFLGATLGGLFGALAVAHLAQPADEPGRLRHHRHGGDRRRLYRRRDDGDPDAVRDDPRLQRDGARHRLGRRRDRRAPRAVAREHLHRQAGAPRALHPEGPPFPHVPDPAREGRHGAGLGYRDAGRACAPGKRGHPGRGAGDAILQRGAERQAGRRRRSRRQ